MGLNSSDQKKNKWLKSQLNKLTLTVLVTTIDALQHFDTG